MYWNLFLNLLISTLLQEALRPKTHFDRPKPAGLDEFNFPTASENRAIPVVFGTKKLAAPNCLWYGDLVSKQVTRRVRTGLLSKEDMPIGFEYYVGMQLGLCVDGVDELLQVWAGEDKVWSGHALPNSEFSVNATWKEGDQDSGLKGVFAFHSGDKVPDAYMGTQVARNPAFKHMTYLVFKGPSAGSGLGYVGVSPNLRALAFVVRRMPKVLRYGVSQSDFDSLSAVGAYDANPAFVALELMGHPGWAAGLPAQRIDVPGIVTAARRLKEEGNGVSLAWDNPRGTNDILLEVAKQCNAVVYTDLRTGLVKFDLLREDDVSVFDFTEDNIVRLESFEISAGTSATNAIRLPFVDIEGDFAERAAVCQDLGGIESAGRIIPATVQYGGVSNGPLALKLASRDMRISASELAKSTFTAVLPKGVYLHPGDLTTMTWPKQGIDRLPVRVLRIDYSEGGRGQVTLDVMQDVFLPAMSMYAASLPSMGGAGTGAAKPSRVDDLELITAPYALSGDDGDHALAYAFAPDATTTGYDLAWYNEDSNAVEYQQRRNIGFAAKGNLVGDIPQAPTMVNVVLEVNAANAATLKRFGSRPVYFYIGNEMCQASGVALSPDGTVATLGGVTRALWDTVPAAHGHGSRVVVLCDYAADPARLKTTVYYESSASKVLKAFDGQTVLNAKAQGRNGSGAASLGSSVAYSRYNGWASESSPPGDGVRSLLPYPPANVRLAGVVGTGTKESGTIVTAPTAAGSQVTLTWTPRNRSAGGLSAWRDGDMRPEAGVGTLVLVESWNGSSWVQLLSTAYGETVTSANLNAAAIPRGAPVRVTISSYTIVPGGTFSQPASLQSQTWYWTFM